MAEPVLSLDGREGGDTFRTASYVREVVDPPPTVGTTFTSATTARTYQPLGKWLSQRNRHNLKATTAP